MADESETRAAEMLPGRVVNLLISRDLQETKSWPHIDGRKTFHEAIPVVLADLVRVIVDDLGVVADSALDKRISHKFTDLAWKKGKRDAEKAQRETKKRRRKEPVKPAKKRKVANEPSDDAESRSDEDTNVSTG